MSGKRKINMTSITRAILVASAVLLGSTSSQAQGGLDAGPVYMPGEMMGMAMTQNVFSAFFSDAEGKVARPSAEFMAMYEKMDANDKAVVRTACSISDQARAGFSDRISAACRAAGF
jgi:hypothetical protein